MLAVVSILPRSPDIGAAPAPSPSPIALTTGTELEAGTTYFMDNAGGFFEGSPRLILTVPGSGWSTAGVFNVGKDYPGGSSPHDIAMTPWGPRNLVDDPCLGQAAGELDPPVGPTVEDLVAGLVEQAGGTASAPTDVTVGGYPGKRLELPSMCDGREFQRWMEGSEHGPYFYGEGQRNIVYVMDVEGVRMVIDTMYVPGVSEEDLAELDALVASMRIEPQDPGATASPTPSP